MTKDEFKKIIKAVSAVYKLNLSRESLSIWYEILKEFTYKEGIMGVQYLFNECDYINIVPATLKKAILKAKEATKKPLPTPEEAWGYVLGLDTGLKESQAKERLDKVSKLIYPALKQIGGFRFIMRLPQTQLPFLAKTFVSAYKNNIMKLKEIEKNKRLMGNRLLLENVE